MEQKKMFMIFTFILLFIITGCSTYPDDPEGVVENMVQDVYEGNHDDAVEYFEDPRSGRMAVNIITAGMVGEGHSPDNFNYILEEESGDEALVRIELEEGRDPGVVELVRTDDKWRIKAESFQ